MDALLDRKTMLAINTALRSVEKPPMKRRDFRWYTVFDQEFADGVAVIEVLSTRAEMFLVIDKVVLGWAEANTVAVEACRTDGRLFEKIFHLFADKVAQTELVPATAIDAGPVAA